MEIQASENIDEGLCCGQVKVVGKYAFFDGVKHIAVGVSHICASTDSLFKCFGSNKDGLLNIPAVADELENGVDFISAAMKHNCVIKKGNI